MSIYYNKNPKKTGFDFKRVNEMNSEDCALDFLHGETLEDLRERGLSGIQLVRG